MFVEVEEAIQTFTHHDGVIEIFGRHRNAGGVAATTHCDVGRYIVAKHGAVNKDSHEAGVAGNGAARHGADGQPVYSRSADGPIQHAAVGANVPHLESHGCLLLAKVKRIFAELQNGDSATL